jgi:hypothetical protein
MSHDQMEKIQKKLEQLSQKHLDLQKTHQQRVKSYKQRVQAFEQKVRDYEQQKSLHQRLFGQPPLQPDPELLVDPDLSPDPELQSVKDEIENLQEDKRRLYDILQAAASIPPPVPEVDWTKSPLYWKRLTKFGLIRPAEQLNAYTTFACGIIGIGYSFSNFYRAHHLFKLTHCTPKTEQWTHHWARARATPEQIYLASYWIGKLQFRGFAALGGPLVFVLYMWSKRKQAL